VLDGRIEEELPNDCDVRQPTRSEGAGLMAPNPSLTENWGSLESLESLAV